jgi:hypothetical protein
LSKRFQIVRAGFLTQVHDGARVPTSRRRFNRTVLVFNLCSAPLGAAHARRRTFALAILAILFGTGFAHQKAGNSGRLGRVAPSPWRRYRARHG